MGVDRPMGGLKVLGQSRVRLEGPDKLRGRARYIADLTLDDTLSARLILSPHARAKIRSIEVDRALAVPGVEAVITDADLRELAGQGYLAGAEVFYAGQPVAVVIARDEATAEDGAERVRVDYEPLPAVIDPIEAMKHDAPLVRPDRFVLLGEDAGAHGASGSGGAGDMVKPRNVNGAVHFRRGNPEGVWDQADVVVANTYRLASVHPGYMETQGLVVEPREDGGVNIWASTQGAFSLQRHVAGALGLPHHMVKVIPMTIGGGFGGKIILHQALIAQVARILNRRVRLIYDRVQDFLSSKPAPAAIIHTKMAARRDGTFLALEAEIIFDSGAAPGIPPATAALVLGSTYQFPHLDVKAYEVLTNKAPVGAYRAPGAPQAFFALESQVDQIARKLGIDPIELRLKNASKEGDPMADGKPWPRIGLVECLERAREHPMVARMGQRRGGGVGGDSTGSIVEGYGVAVGGWLGGMEPAAASCRLEGDGVFTLHIGAVDLTGTDTTLAMIAAETLGVDPSAIRVVKGDTTHAPVAGMSAGSKVIYTVGAAVQQAAQDALQQILAIAAHEMEAAVDDLELVDGAVVVKGAPSRAMKLSEIAKLTTGYGSRHAPVAGNGRTAIYHRSPGFTVHVARVQVDVETGQIKPVEYLAVQDVGKALNPAEVEGQIHGGVAQGIGRALLEAREYDGFGQPQNASLADYLLPSATDVPSIQVELVEVPSEHGPYGAKGVGEPPAVPGVAAIANAVADATGVRLTDAPFTPAAFIEAAGRNG